MSKRTTMEVFFIFWITFGLPFSFYLGFKTNVHLELIVVHSRSLVYQVFFGHIMLGLVSTATFLMVTAVMMFTIDSKITGLEGQEKLYTNGVLDEIGEQ